MPTQIDSTRFFSVTFGEAAALLSTFALFCTVAAATAGAQSTPVPLAPERWIHSQRNFKIPEPPPQHNAEIVEFLGRPCFRMARGLAFARGIEFQDGVIDVDMAADDRSRFLGVAFRIQSDDDYEVIFFRPGGSGTNQAVQYTPGLRGANAWQIYTGPGYTAAAAIPRNRWIHVQIVVSGIVAKLYLEHSAEPTLVVSDLKQGQSKGSIGFWGHLGGGYFSNLTITPERPAQIAQLEPNFQPGTLTDWELSEIFDVGDIDPATYPKTDTMKWQKVQADGPGMLVINRYRRSPNIDTPERADRIRGPVAGSKVVFARTTIRSDRDQFRKMKLGYSDEVVVYLNGKPIYAGNNSLSFRQPNFLGLLDAESDAVYLPLKKGDNELLLAVTEFFGGWGLLCQLDPP
jgi:hypothetical protein